MTVDIAGITAEAVDPARVIITRITGRTAGAGVSAARALIAGVSGFATGGEVPTAYVQISGAYGFARNTGPVPGQSLLAQWDGERWVRLPVVTWDGTSWVGAS